MSNVSDNDTALFFQAIELEAEAYTHYKISWQQKLFLSTWNESIR
jgi:hypothetical protein